MNFYDVLAAEKWSGGIPTTNFFDLLFAQSMGGGEQWQTYEGTLPATLNTNGGNMRQYQIYGNTGGVGGVTKNEFDVDWIDGEYIGSDLKNIQLSVKPNTAYTMKSNCPRYNNAALVFFDYKKSSSTTSDNGVWNGQTRTITSTDNGTLYVRYQNNNTGYDLTSYLYMLTEGTTPPENYVPYGYEVDIGVESGNLCHDIFRRGTLAGAINTARCILIPSINCTVGDTYTIKIYDSNYKYAVYGLTDAQAEQFNSGAFIESSTLVPFDSGWQEATFTFTVTDPNIAAFTIMIAYRDNSEIFPSQATQILSISNGTTPPDEYQPYYNATTPIYIGNEPLEKDEYLDYQTGKMYRRTDNLFNIDDLWDKGQTGTGDEASIFLEIPVENGIYTVGTNVPNNSNPNIASVFFASSLDVNPSSSNSGVFINHPRTNTTTTGKLYIGIRVRSAAGYQTFTKETFAPYYINVVSGSSVPTTAIPYLQPTDPPVPLPALPTCKGETVIDYAGESVAPEKVYFEYQGGKQP